MGPFSDFSFGLAETVLQLLAAPTNNECHVWITL